MSDNEIREPIQKRSIEKKEKIIKSGFELICEKGYYNTNTAEIAKKAGVSTGIVYQYFKDKHDIFIAGLEKYGDTIFYPIPDINKNDFKEKNFSEILKHIIQTFISDHKLSESAHEEITAMVHSDKNVAYFFYKREMEMTIQFSNILKESGIKSSNLLEKVHIIIGMIDNLCHEVVYHKHKDLNYDIMIDLVVDNIIKFLE
ncbi:MAG: TetR/AcrR family transcriptional regulator [Clostridia bacterium]|nr:TetR/AcrR family transcriptional regulator [Clostridia bacterium]